MINDKIAMKSGLCNARNAFVASILIFFIFSVYNHISLNQANNKLKASTIELEDKVEVLDTQLRAVQDSKLKCLHKLNSMGKEVSDMNELKKKISDMKTAQDAQTSALSKENESLKSQLQQLQNDYKQLSEKAENLESTNQKLSKDKESEINQLKTEHDNEIARLKDEIANFKRSIREPSNANNDKKPFVKIGGDDKEIVNEQVHAPKDQQKLRESYRKLGRHSVNPIKNDDVSLDTQKEKDGSDRSKKLANQAAEPGIPKVEDKEPVAAQDSVQKSAESQESNKVVQSNKADQSNKDSDSQEQGPLPDTKKVIGDKNPAEQQQNILPKPDDEQSMKKPRKHRMKRDNLAVFDRDEYEPRMNRRQNILNGNRNSEDGDQNIQALSNP